MIELARYRQGPSKVVAWRDGDDLVFWSEDDDYGKSIVSESRIPIIDFVAKGEGPWPWFDLGDRREGALLVLDALDEGRPPWTEPLPPEIQDMFERAQSGSTSSSNCSRWAPTPTPSIPAARGRQFTTILHEIVRLGRTVALSHALAK